MRVGDLVTESLGALRANRLRSFLTLLGIIIGVTTIVGVVSVINGLDRYVKDKVLLLAPDVYVLTKFGIIQGRDEFLAALRRKNIDLDDYRKLRDVMVTAQELAANTNTTAPLKFRERRFPDVAVLGGTANFGPMLGFDIAAGRYYIDAEDRTAQPVVVIGWDVKDELFGPLDPVGRTITVGGLPCRVIGVIAQQGKVLGESRDNEVFIPMQTFIKHFGRQGTIDIFVKAAGGVAGVDRSVDEARAVLRALRHTPYKDPDPFGLVTAEALQDLWKKISGASFMLMILIASVSLGVGGIVIMNIMLVSVLERTQEIGVRKAIGAKEADIRRQFLLEATMLSLAGGVIGALLGAGAAFAVETFTGFPAQVTMPIITMGMLLSVVVGLAAGYLPARNASRLHAIEALRVE